MKEFARVDDHWRLTLAHSTCHQGLRRRAGNYLSRKTTPFSDYVERHHGTYKAEYSSWRWKDLTECSAIASVTNTLVLKHVDAKACEGGSD
jgi:hypothetical protein